MKRHWMFGSLLVLMLAGCVTNIRATSEFNPPPTRALNTFGSFELKPLAADSGVKEAKARAKIAANLENKLRPLLAGWQGSQGGTLVIEPRVRELKFVGSGGRVIGGWIAGSSAVRMTVRMTDKETGAVIAEPEFFQRAAAMGGAYSFGGTDHAMLVRIASVVAEYLQRNHDAAVGGPTGLDSAEADQD